MRYYEITITPVGSTTPFRTFSSHPNGVFDPGALNVEFDMPVLPYGTPGGGQSISIHGISLQDLAQSQQFAGMNLTIKGGMKAGLPLVNPSQAGTLVAGNIFQSFGNWEGTEMTLDFVLNPAVYTLNNPGNFVLIWEKQEQLADALKHCLQVPYPDMDININISPDLVNNYKIVHPCTTFEQLAQFIGDMTEKQFNGNRVELTIQGGKIVAYDSTYQPSPVQLQFTDFIGQPTWIEPNVMQIKTVMRADLQLGDRITMPKGFQNLPGFVATSAASSPSTVKYKSTFENNFLISELRQIGNFRSSSAADWSTIFNCVPI